MTKSIPLSRAVAPAAAVLGACLFAFACPAAAFTPATSAAKGSGENAALNLNPSSSIPHTSSGGASLVRTIVGLAIVIAVIWGLTWILRQVKAVATPSAPEGGLASVAALTLGSGRSLHLVRAGSDYLLLGSAEHGLVPIHRYTEEQAREAGLLGSAPRRACARERDGGVRVAAAGRPGLPLRAGRGPDADALAVGSGSSSACANGRSAGEPELASNAVQILLLIGGLTLVPAVLFTVTGFSRILIVLGFIRTAVGTSNAPPNQVLVGIALFLTIFVMAPTIGAIKNDRGGTAGGSSDQHDHRAATGRDPDAGVHVPQHARRRTSSCSSTSRTPSRPTRARKFPPRC